MAARDPAGAWVFAGGAWWQNSAPTGRASVEPVSQLVARCNSAAAPAAFFLGALAKVDRNTKRLALIRNGTAGS